MSNRSVWLAWLLVLPLALILGYLLATPDSLTSFGFVGMLLFGLSIPLLLRWHYPILIFSWNAMLVPYFLPGHPPFWMLMVFLSATFSLFRLSVNREDKSVLSVPSLTRPLIVLSAIVALTALVNGGFGLSALGSETFGGKKYVYIFAAVIGFFAITAQPIPKQSARFYTALLFLPGLTAVISNLAYMAGPAFYFLFALFPPDAAVNQASAEQSAGVSVIRIVGLSTGCTAVICAILAHNGIRELLRFKGLWKLLLLLLAVFASLLGGFRSAFIISSMLFAFLFFFEGLHRTRYIAIAAIGLILLAAFTLPFVSKFPLPVQRALSILPIKVDPIARADAENSTRWRVEMWQIVLPQVPQYLWKGKGYALDPNDLYLAELLVQSGKAKSSEVAMLAGDYHNGALSIIIPFGVFGLLGVVWFMLAGMRALYLNYRYGDPDLSKINAFLLAFYLTRFVYFWAVYGAIEMSLQIFVGIIAFSISLNHGVKRKPSLAPEFTPANEVLAPA